MIEISIRGNDLQTLDAAQFPLDSLHRLHLANNPLVCNCSLLWLWQLTTGQTNEIILNKNNNSSGIFKSNTASNIPNNKFNNTISNVLILDINEIACDLYEDSVKISRHIMKNMSSNDIRCPANIVTIISAILSILLILLTGASIIFYVRYTKHKKNVMTERKNKNERIVPQQVNKFELERYLAAQEVQNEYRALRQWELTMKENIEEPDHYENFEDFRFDTRRSQKPHVVYV